MNGLLDTIARYKTGRSKRISSYARDGTNWDSIKIAAGETVDIAHIRGAGVIRHIWITTGHKDPMHYRNMILRMYWDCEKKSRENSSLRIGKSLFPVATPRTGNSTSSSYDGLIPRVGSREALRRNPSPISPMIVGVTLVPENFIRTKRRVDAVDLA